jgi:hypothetical protein
VPKAAVKGNAFPRVGTSVITSSGADFDALHLVSCYWDLPATNEVRWPLFFLVEHKSYLSLANSHSMELRTS